jgi:hypothetical protein
VTDLTHFLNTKNAIESQRGPERKMADFLTTVVARASDVDRSAGTSGPLCFKCRKKDRSVVDTAIIEANVVIWRCPARGSEWRILNWQGSFWDVRRGRQPR